MTSIFSRIYSYREKEGRSQLENYLIEILSFCLETDDVFAKDLFKELNISIQKESLKVTSQSAYTEYGRPDIEVEGNDVAILFECKVEAGERNNQLNDYCCILNEFKNDFKNKHLVYLTKYYESKTPVLNGVNFHYYRWHQVFNLINETHSPITLQLKTFLKENGMESVKNFSLNDLLAMQTIAETIAKMDEVLDYFKPVFASRFGGYSKDSSRSTYLSSSSYCNFVTLKYDKKDYSLYVGFFWWSEEEEQVPTVGLSLELSKKSFRGSRIISIFNKHLIAAGWKDESTDDIYYFSAVKPLTEFIVQEEDQFISIKKYLESQLQVLYDIQQHYPKGVKK